MGNIGIWTLLVRFELATLNNDFLLLTMYLEGGRQKSMGSFRISFVRILGMGLNIDFFIKLWIDSVEEVGKLSLDAIG